MGVKYSVASQHVYHKSGRTLWLLCYSTFCLFDRALNYLRAETAVWLYIGVILLYYPVRFITLLMQQGTNDSNVGYILVHII